MILVIDNYDSFTYNLVQILGFLHGAIEVHRNDALDPEAILERKPAYLVLSPGPGRPSDAGRLLEIIQRCSPHIPTLGVCLGHQAIAEAYGGRIIAAPQLIHGQASPVYHGGDGLFSGLPQPFEAGRYHSWVVDPESLPDELIVTAHGADGVIMGLAHRCHPIVGVQFHPESILTPVGGRLLRNFLRLFRAPKVAA